jgi:hypothetical protein
MPATEPRRTPEELARLGSEVFERRVRPMLQPEDDGKFVALDVQIGDYEVDEDERPSRGCVPATRRPRPGSVESGSRRRTG